MKDILIFRDDGIFVDARKIHEKIVTTNGKGTEFAKWMTRMCSYGFKEGVDYIMYWSDGIDNHTRIRYLGSHHKMASHGYRKEYHVTLDMAKDICRKQRRNIMAAKILKYLLSFDNKEVFVVEPERKELVFVEKLKEILKSFDLGGITQYKVLNYRIDYYIPKLNIAIEYDENDHKNYTYERQEGRQREIEKELGCKFIRVSDKDSDEYNIGYIIKEMFNININVA